ncbi:MAG: DUF2958 domain-containing protein [Desulfitobacteriia bacterium]|jgi:hypothetical protein
MVYMARIKLITKELEKKLPNIGKSTPKGDPICLIKLFNPCGAGTWWIAEKEKDGDLLYGIAEIFEREIGYFSLSEIEALQCPGAILINGYKKRFSLPVERDLYFDPTPMSEIMKDGGY